MDGEPEPELAATAEPEPDAELVEEPEEPELERRPVGGATGYRVVELSVNADGSVRGEVRQILTPEVYSRPVAVKFAQHEAKKMDRDKSVVVLVDPYGRGIGVYGGETGRSVGARIAHRAKKMLGEVMPEVIRQRRRRTTREPNAQPRRRTTRR